MYDKNLNNMRIWSIPTKLQTVFHIYVFLYFISQNPLKVRILSIFPNWIPTLKITNFSWYNLYEYPMYEWLDSTKYVCGIFVGSPCPMTWTFKASLGIWNDIFFIYVRCSPLAKAFWMRWSINHWQTDCAIKCSTSEM